MTIITILKEICFALLYLWNARKTIYRRELSSHSIYYTNENQLKLTDYGYTATASYILYIYYYYLVKRISLY